jgi:uncharacterized membrane protein YiaA
MLEAQPSRTWPSDALLIAGTPALIYLLTLVYHLAFADYFGVPFQFVSVSWTDAFAAVGVLLGLSALVYSLLLLLLSVTTRPGHAPGYSRALTRLPTVVIVLTGFFALSFMWSRRLILAVIVGCVLGFLSSIAIYRERKEYKDSDVARARRWEAAIAALLWIIAGVYAALLIGTVHAKYQTAFYVSDGAAELVILGIWGDTVVAAPFDRSTRIVKRKYIVTKISDHSPLEFRTENIGPLKLENPQ